MITENTAVKPALELEVMPPEVAAVSTELHAPKETALASFTPFQKLFADSASLLAKEKDATTPKDARKLRLEMRAHRSACKQTKDTVKADILLAGRLADAYFNRVTGPLENAEARLDEIEKAAERAEAARKATLKAERTTELSAFGVDCQFYDLGAMPAEGYAQLLSSSKVAHEARLAAEAKAKEEALIAAEKAEAERIAREKAEAAERERIKAEAERLRVENERLAAERAEAEKKARAEREALEAAAKAEREKAAEAARVAAEQARKEREALEAKAAAERKEAARLAQIEREKREALEAAERARVAAEKKRQEEEAEAARRAAAAPDQEKLKAFAELVKTLEVPELTTPEGKQAAQRVGVAVGDLLNAIRREWLALQGGAK
jgi:hypothetical protein